MVDTIRLDQMAVTGASRGGVGTWFKVQPPGAAFDVGHGAPELSGVSRVFLTHGHLDHAAGLPFLLSQRSLQDLGKTDIYCPAPMLEALRTYVQAGARLEGASYDYELHGLEPGDRVSASKAMSVEAFATSHLSASLGYHLVESVSRLKSEYISMDSVELAALRRSGVDIERREDRLWLSYCGDTGADLLDEEPRVFEARVLLLECTFMGDGWREKAAEYRHIHLEDLIERSERFANEVIVLHHLSRRFTPEELQREVERCLPELAPRVRILGAKGRTSEHI